LMGGIGAGAFFFLRPKFLQNGTKALPARVAEVLATEPAASTPEVTPPPAPVPAAAPAADLIHVALILFPLNSHVFDKDKDLGMMPITIDLKPGETKLVNVVRKGYVTRPLKLDGSKTRVVVGLVSETQASKHKGLTQAEAEAEADRAAEHAAADDATEEVTPVPEGEGDAAAVAKTGAKPGAKVVAAKTEPAEKAPEKPDPRPRGKTPLAPNPFGD